MTRGSSGHPGGSVGSAQVGSAPTVHHPLRRLWRLADPDRARLALAAFLAFCALGSAVGLLVVSAWLISRASQQPPILYLQVAIVAVRAFGISRGVFRYAERIVGHDAALRSLTTLRVAVYRRLERLSPAGLGEYRRGDLLARLVGDVDSSVDLIVRVALPVVAGLAAGVLATVIGAALLPAAGVAFLVLLVVSGFLAPWLTGSLGARAQRSRAEAEGRLTAQVVSALASAPELLAYGTVDAAVAQVRSVDSELTAIDRRSATASGLGDALGALATGLTIAAGIGLGVSAVRAGTLDGVWLAALALIPMAMADVLSGMPAAALARARVTGAAERLLTVLDTPDPVPEAHPLATARPSTASGAPAHPSGAPGARPVQTPAPTAGASPEQGEQPEPAVQPEPAMRRSAPALTLEGMSARYPRATSDAVAELDLRLGSGQRVALVGPSGSGKSTVAAVLLRLLDLRKGRYRLGSDDVHDLTEDDVRAQLTAMDQSAHLFDSTIEENIRLARRSASDEELADVLVGARLDSWIAQLPDGLRTRVGAHGTAVSGGQAQRIALARVLLADAPIVVLDEPGEHLDPQMADEVTQSALTATEGRSVLLITHRMSHTEDCDEVVVLSEGRVAQVGRPDELGGWYAAARARELGDPTDG